MEILDQHIQRKIIHIDMDAFYASIEQRDHPELRGKALAVGGSPTGRGVVATASYEARKFGVRSAMSSQRAIFLCPHLLFVKPRFEIYKSVSAQIREIFSRYTDLIEPLSLDEAYLDVTEDKLGIGSAITIASQIKDAIKSELHLTASAGISVNKFIAKIASDINKPDGMTFIGPSKIEKFMEELSIDQFHGVGKVTAAKMNALQIFKGADLKKLSEEYLMHHFGKSGQFYYHIVRGVDNRPVQPFRERKSLGSEDTFSVDLEEIEDMNLELDRIALDVHQRLVKHHLSGRTLTLKVKFGDFTQITRNLSFPQPIQSKIEISEAAQSLLEKVDLNHKKVRLLGISLSNFNTSPLHNSMNQGSQQLELFPNYPDQLK
jgi:DNA polymerase-4